MKDINYRYTGDKAQLRKKVYIKITACLTAAALTLTFTVFDAKVNSKTEDNSSVCYAEEVQNEYNGIYYMVRGTIRNHEPFNYSTEAIITGCSDSIKVLDIPETINGTTVRQIEEYAFKNKTQIEEVHIPDTVRNIGFGAFQGTSFEYYADGWLLRGCSEYLERDRTGTILSIKEGIRGIGPEALVSLYQSEIKNVIFPESLRHIGREAVMLGNIRDIVIPEGVESIGYEAFLNCNSLKSVTLLNPWIDLPLGNKMYAFYPGCKIKGYNKSTAEGYCRYFYNTDRFESIGPIPEEKLKENYYTYNKAAKRILSDTKTTDEEYSIFDAIRAKRKLLVMFS